MPSSRLDPSYVAVTFFGIWYYETAAAMAAAAAASASSSAQSSPSSSSSGSAGAPVRPQATCGHFVDLEGLSQLELPEEAGPDGTRVFPFALVTTFSGDEAPPPKRLRLYASSAAERATWMAAVDAALALWTSHATPASTNEGRLLLRSSVHDQFGLLRKASGYLSTSTEWRTFVLEFNLLRYSRELSLLAFDR